MKLLLAVVLSLLAFTAFGQKRAPRFYSSLITADSREHKGAIIAVTDSTVTLQHRDKQQVFAYEQTKVIRIRPKRVAPIIYLTSVGGTIYLIGSFPGAILSRTIPKNLLIGLGIIASGYIFDLLIPELKETIVVQNNPNLAATLSKYLVSP